MTAIQAHSSSTSDPMVPVPYVVERITKETADTFTLQLTSAGGDASPAFKPGQFNMLYMFGVGEVPISISGGLAESSGMIHTIRAVGTVTNSMARLRQGDIVGLRGPFGSSWPITTGAGKDIILVAGGIGLAPLRPALLALLADRQRFGRITLLYGTRSPQDILYQSDLERWRSSLDIDVHVTVDRGAKEWRGNVGVVTTLVPKASLDSVNTMALICGPEVMMHYAIISLEKRGLSNQDIYVSMERNMKCAVGYCGHCQFGPTFICKDGPVFRLDQVDSLLAQREL